MDIGLRMERIPWQATVQLMVTVHRHTLTGNNPQVRQRSGWLKTLGHRYANLWHNNSGSPVMGRFPVQMLTVCCSIESKCVRLCCQHLIEKCGWCFIGPGYPSPYQAPYAQPSLYGYPPANGSATPGNPSSTTPGSSSTGTPPTPNQAQPVGATQQQREQQQSEGEQQRRKRFREFKEESQQVCISNSLLLRLSQAASQCAI